MALNEVICPACGFRNVAPTVMLLPTGGGAIVVEADLDDFARHMESQTRNGFATAGFTCRRCGIESTSRHVPPREVIDLDLLRVVRDADLSRDEVVDAAEIYATAPSLAYAAQQIRERVPRAGPVATAASRQGFSARRVAAILTVFGGLMGSGAAVYTAVAPPAPIVIESTGQATDVQIEMLRSQINDVQRQMKELREREARDRQQKRGSSEP